MILNRINSIQKGLWSFSVWIDQYKIRNKDYLNKFNRVTLEKINNQIHTQIYKFKNN